MMNRRPEYIALFFALCGIVVVAGGSVRAQPADSVSASSAPVVHRLVEEALAKNLSLEQERISLEQSRAALAQTQGQYLPRLDLKARYTRSRGGRTIDFPVGDAVNPAYEALDQMNPNQQFPRLENQEISLVREKEQRTELQLRQPLYQPEIRHGVEAKKHEVHSQEASVDARRRRLARDVRTAYYRYRKAQARVEVLQAARTRVRENRRTNEQLLAAEKITQDAVRRAEAEVLAVRQKLTQARAAVDQAHRRLNVLRDRPANAEIPGPQTAIETRIDRRVRTIEQGLGRPLFGADALADAGSGSVGRATAPSAVAATAQASAPADSLDRAHDLVDDRPALQQLDAAAKAAEAQRRAAQTDFFPTVSLGVDAGIQGDTYGISGDKPFARASLILEWNLFDGLSDHRRVQRRRLETKRLRTQRQHMKQQLTQEMHRHLDDVRTARQSLQTARARADAAQESFRLTRRRYDAGRANQVTLIDARTTLTEAELNLNVTRYDLLIHLAALAHAAGLSPVASQ